MSILIRERLGGDFGDEVQVRISHWRELDEVEKLMGIILPNKVMTRRAMKTGAMGGAILEITRTTIEAGGVENQTSSSTPHAPDVLKDVLTDWPAKGG